MACAWVRRAALYGGIWLAAALLVALAGASRALAQADEPAVEEWVVRHFASDGARFMGYARIGRGMDKASVRLTWPNGEIYGWDDGTVERSAGGRLTVTFYSGEQVIWLPPGEKVLANCTYTVAGQPCAARQDPAPPAAIELRIELDPVFGTTSSLEGSWVYANPLLAANLRGKQRWAPARPRIDHVVVLEDAAEEGAAPAGLRYPYDRAGAVVGPLTRTLFVVGEDLPELYSDPVVFSAGDAPLAYTLEAIESFDGSEPGNRERFAKGWQALAAKGVRRDEQQAILVRAGLQRGVLPGDTVLRLNDASASWLLKFADATASIAFMRSVNDVTAEPTPVAFVNEEVFVELRLDADIPFVTVPVLFGPDAASIALSGQPLAAYPVDDDPRRYRTEPIRLDTAELPGGPAGSARVATVTAPGEIVGAPGAPRQLQARPTAARLRIETSPLRVGGQFVEGLRRAAACRDIVPPDGDWYRFAATESDRISNLIVFQLERLSVPVKLGDHAAMILLRDEFVRMLRAALPEYEQIQADEALVAGYRKLLEPLRLRDDVPILSVPVTSLTGGTVPYFATFLREAAEEAGVSPAAFETWGLAQTRVALDRFVASMQAAIARAAAAGDCDVEELLTLTGLGFDAVVAGLVPKLMRLEEDPGSGRQSWRTDDVGRAWVRGLATLAAAVKAQREVARIDNTMIALSLAVVSIGSVAILGEGVLGHVVALSVDLADLSFTAATEIPAYLAGQREVAFALGASEVLGVERLEQARLEERGFLDLCVAVLGSAAGGVFSALNSASDLARLKRIADMVRRGEGLAELLIAGRFDGLDDVQRADLGAFLADAKARQLADGEAALTDTQRRALQALEARAPATQGSGLVAGDVRPSGVGDVLSPGDVPPGGTAILPAPDLPLPGTVVLAGPDLPPPGTLRLPEFDPPSLSALDAPALPLPGGAVAEDLIGTAPPGLRLPGAAGNGLADLSPPGLRAPDGPAGAADDLAGPGTAEDLIGTAPPGLRLPDADLPSPELRVPDLPGAAVDDLSEAGTAEDLVGTGYAPRPAGASPDDVAGLPELDAGDDFIDTLRPGASLPEAPAVALAAPAPPGATRAATANAEFAFVAQDGQPVRLALGDLLGEGASSKAFVLQDEPAFVVRITDLSDLEKQASQLDAAALDEFGRRALDDPAIDGEVLRVVDRRERYLIGDPPTGVVEVVERVPSKAIDLYRTADGLRMTDGQALAFDRATRELNSRGYAWLDNHEYNYTLERLPGEDQWRVVIFDPGGIVPMKGADLAERAANARAIQGRIANPDPEFAAKYLAADERGKLLRAVVESGNILDEFAARIDFDALGLLRPEELKFRPSGVISYPNAQALFRLSDEEAAAAYAAHRAASSRPRRRQREVTGLRGRCDCRCLRRSMNANGLAQSHRRGHARALLLRRCRKREHQSRDGAPRESAPAGRGVSSLRGPCACA